MITIDPVREDDLDRGPRGGGTTTEIGQDPDHRQDVMKDIDQGQDQDRLGEDMMMTEIGGKEVHPGMEEIVKEIRGGGSIRDDALLSLSL